MNSEIKQQWVDALESGDFKQGLNRLCSVNEEYCCLGVLCTVLKEPFDEPTPMMNISRGLSNYGGNAFSLPNPLREKVGLSEDAENRLIRMNDSGESFQEIAKYIRENL